MPLVLKKPEIRFEKVYDGLVTVIEGEELHKLISRFYWHFRRQLKLQDEFIEAFFIAVFRAYQGLYRASVVSWSELETLSTANSRKLDLFYRGMYLLVCEAMYPDEDWEKRLHGAKSFLTFLNDVVTLKPNLFGIGIDLKALIKRLHTVRR